MYLQKSNKIALVVGAGSEWRKYRLSEIDSKKYDVIRVNNFFFEDQFYFGTRVDYLFFGGDRYLLPDYVNTLRKAAEMGYSIGEIVMQKGLKNQKKVELFSKVGFSVSLYSVPTMESKHRPTTGMVALQWALSSGYRKVLALNFDFYKEGVGYPFILTGMARKVLKNNKAGYGSPFHKKKTDTVFLQDNIKKYFRSELTFVHANKATKMIKANERESTIKKINISDWEKVRGSSVRMFVRSVILSLKLLKIKLIKGFNYYSF